MLAIKVTAMDKMPQYCDYCCWHEIRPHPYKGWTETCGLCMHCMDDTEPEEWIYDGNGRPRACPLVELPTPHGRLIDADALIVAYDAQYEGEPGRARKLIEDAPTVIEAEGE